MNELRADNESDWNEMVMADEAKQKTAKRRSCCLAVFVLLLCLMSVPVAGLIAFDKCFGYNFLPSREEMGVYPSPSGKYTVTLYLQDGGATTDFAVVGVRSNNRNARTKTIYYKYHCQSGEVEWLDNHTVVINGTVLDVRWDVYN